MAAITVNSPVHKLFVSLEEYHADSGTREDGLDNDWYALRRILRDRSVISGKAPISEMLEKKNRIIEVYDAKKLMDNIERIFRKETDATTTPSSVCLTVQQINKIFGYKKLHDTMIEKFDELCNTIAQKTDVQFNFDNPDRCSLEKHIDSGVLRKHPRVQRLNDISFDKLKEVEQRHMLFKHKVAQMSKVVKFFEKCIHEIEA